MTIPERAAQIAVEIANDDRHGYSQANRYGTLDGGDFDCSSLVIYCYDRAFMEVGLTPPKAVGASYTGNMLAAFTRIGFRAFRDDHGAGLQVGDILLNEAKHTAIVCSLNPTKVVNAGGDRGYPQSGDQTGTEIRVQTYWSYPWDWVMRYYGKEPTPADETPTGTVGQQMAQHIIANRKYPTIKYGDTGDAVMFAQAILVRLGFLNRGKDYVNVDGDFGVLTKSAALGFQSSTKDSADPLEIDGIIGKKTWERLLQAVKE